MGLGKSRHPMRNSRLLFLVRFPSLHQRSCVASLFLTSRRVCLCLTKVSHLSLVEFSLTHFPPVDLDFSRLPITRFPSFLGIKKKIPEKQKVVQIFMVWQGGNRNKSGKVDCLCECEDRGESPTLTKFVNSKSHQLSFTDSPLSTLVWHNELMVGNVVLMNKEP
jgi:hypothetical protein